MHEYAAKVQRIEIAGLNGKDLPIERLGLGQLPALMMIDGSPEDVGNARFCGLRLDLWFGHGLEGLRMPRGTQRYGTGAFASESCARLFACSACVQADARWAQAGIGTGPMSFGTL